MILREATEDDLGAVERLYCSSVDDSVVGITERFYLARKHGLPFVVAEEDNTVIGFTCANPFRYRGIYRFSVEESIYVAQEWRKKKVGCALLARLIHKCTLLGLHQMVAVIADRENTASVRLHESLGFVKVGELACVGHGQGRCLTTVVMQRSLAPCPQPGKVLTTYECVPPFTHTVTQLCEGLAL
jgi:phosphinothricin acetyltransferase